MSFIDRFFTTQLSKAQADITKKVVGELTTHVDNSLSKSTNSNPYITGTGSGTGVKRYQFTQDMINGGTQRKQKPGANVSFETLRMFSIQHEVTRACVNLRKRQITGLDWTIVTSDPDDTGTYDTQVKEIKEFFKHLGGRGIGYRRFMDKFIEDLMVLDAVTLEKQRMRKGTLHNLIPIDAATIRLRVDESGATPEPPETAYVQVIRGEVTAEFTDDEMIYEMMNPRNDTPYGLAPLESLIIIVTSSLKAGMYNLGYLTDGNIPEGMFTMPETWQPQQIKDFQEYFDALMAGDETMTSKLKFMPDGKYTPTKKRDEMAFEQFNDWLMHITCALFEVTPRSIGFTPKQGMGGRGDAEDQNNIGIEKGLMPLAMFIEECFTKVIQEEFGFTHLRFDFPALRQKDAKSTADLNAVLINSGQRSIDELRTDDGLAPLPDGLGSRPFVPGTVSYLETQEMSDQKAQQAADAAKPPVVVDTNAKDAPIEPKDTAKSIGTIMTIRREQIDELKTFRKYAVNRLKADKTIRPFVSSVLSSEMTSALNKSVINSNDLKELRQSFEEPIKSLELENIDVAIEVRNGIMAVL